MEQWPGGGVPAGARPDAMPYVGETYIASQLFWTLVGLAAANVITMFVLFIVFVEKQPEPAPLLPPPPPPPIPPPRLTCADRDQLNGQQPFPCDSYNMDVQYSLAALPELIVCEPSWTRSCSYELCCTTPPPSPTCVDIGAIGVWNPFDCEATYDGITTLNTLDQTGTCPPTGCTLAMCCTNPPAMVQHHAVDPQDHPQETVRFCSRGC